MFLWHLGGALLIGRYVFRDAAMDLRWLAVGAILPDVIDKPIASILFNETFHAHRVYGHTLVFAALGMVAALLLTKRGTSARRAAFAVILGVFVHLGLDGAWTTPETFLWPVFGWGFPEAAGTDFPSLVSSMVKDPLVWVGEGLGAAYLVYLWWRYLRAPGAVGGFLRTGRIPMPARGDGA